MKNWWWIRHGPTHAKCMVGWADIAADLSDKSMLIKLDEYLPRQAVSYTHLTLPTKA